MALSVFMYLDDKNKLLQAMRFSLAFHEPLKKKKKENKLTDNNKQQMLWIRSAGHWFHATEPPGWFWLDIQMI